MLEKGYSKLRSQKVKYAGKYLKQDSKKGATFARLMTLLKAAEMAAIAGKEKAL